MLYLLNKDVRTVRWNGEPLHEATSAIVKEIMNGDFTLTVKYPISDSGIYQLIQEDMLIKAPTPVLGAQLFRIKKPVEYNDHLEITAYHISDDVMQRSITPVSVTSQSCGMALSRMVQNTKTALGDFSFNSDIQDRRTFNTTETETLYSILLDGKHSIVGTWEGELVRDNFAITVKKSRGENRGVVITTHKNLKNYQRTKNSQNVVTRIHAKSTFKPEGAEKETTIRVTVDSPLINSYPYINEKEYENNNAKTVEELQKWAQSKFSNEGIDKVSDAIKIEAYELDGQVVHMGDTVNLKSWKHNVDAFKKAIAYEFDALKEEYISLTFDDKAGIGGSRASGGLSSAADAILGVTESAQEIALEKALQNADLDFDHKAGLLRQEISDDIELAKAKAEEVKRELSDTINQRFNSFDNGPLKEAKRKAEEALRNAGASSSLAQESKRIGLDSVARLEAFKSQTTSAQTALSGDLDALKRTIANDIRPKQAQAEAEIAKQVEALSRTKNELDGASTLLAQEAKRIELDSVARLEAFKSQTTSAQTALSGDLDALKRTIANDIRPKQAQAETEIAKQVEALSRTKNELAGVKSAQATYKETTTRRLSELTNLANGKASKSELTQTAEELSSKIASVQASGRNLFLNSLFKQDISKTGIWTTSTYTATIDSESKYLGHKALKIIGLNPSGRDGGNPKVTYPALGQFGKVIPGSTTNQDVTISFYAKANKNGIMIKSRLGNIGYKTGNVTLSTEIKRYVVHIPKGWTNESKQTTNEWLFNFNQEGTIWIWMPKFEISDVDTSYSEAPEDIEGQISTVESTFKQRANSLEAGVSRLTEGLRTKADISSLNVTAENIRQSVKSLETDTQNKLNQKLSQAEFEVRAGSIRQEILNATKNKASKSELTQTAEELASRIASVKVGGRNYYRDSEKIRTSTRFFSFPLHPYLSQENVGETWTLSFDLKINEGGEIRPLLFYHYQTNRFGLKASADITPSKEWQRFTFTGPVIFPNDDPRYSRGEMALYDHGGNNNYSVRRIKLEKGTLATDWSPAPEDIEGQISTVESTFKQRANSLEAGVNRLTEGLRTKVDISALNVTAENIRQSVKSLETDTQNKLNQKLSQAEFEVRAGSIRQEILNATKDKASKSELTQTAEELASRIASVQVGG
ncbi:TPA: phage tail spike protein, partial [Streptococcus pneumoniae]